MKATLFDVCRLTGLSTATVSRVLNNSPLVRGKTRAKVMKAMRQLNYRPSPAARSLALRRSEAVGVVFPHVTGAFHTEILRGIDEVADEHGYHLLTAFSHNPHDQRDLVQQMLREGRVDAMIVLNLDIPESFFKTLAAESFPLVLIDRPAAVPGVASITMNNEEAAGAAFVHLLRHAPRNVAVLTGPKDVYDSARRLVGCRQAAERAGVPASEIRVLTGDFRRESGEELVQRMLRQKKLPRGIMALNDHMALGALGALRDAGVKVPEDVALIGFDDIEAAQYLSLTTVRIPVREMGRAAAEVAIRAVKYKEPLVDRVLPAKLIVRRSCGCLRVVEGVGPAG